jgi:hypothetical protein
LFEKGDYKEILELGRFSGRIQGDSFALGRFFFYFIIFLLKHRYEGCTVNEVAWGVGDNFSDLM